MDTFDFVIIGAGPAGEAAAYKARELGASVAVDRPALVRRQLPAHRLPAVEVAARRRGPARRQPGDVRLGATPRRSATTWSTGRPDADEPDDSSHVRGLRDAGAVDVPRAAARIVGRGPGERQPRRRDPRARGHATSSSPSGSYSQASRRSTGSTTIPTWTNREATLARELPTSLLVLGGGPTGCELAQVYARFGVPDHDRPVRAAPGADRPSAQLRGDPGGARARRRRRPDRRPRRSGPGPAPARTAPTSSSSTTGRRPRATRSCSRSGAPSRSTTSASSTTASTRAGGRPFPRDGRLRIADGLWVIGDPAGPELHTHQGHYQGELAVRMALGEAVVPDYRALPRATYTDPEAAFVGLTLERRPRGRPRRLRARRRLRRRAPRATRSRPSSGTSRSSSTGPAASWSGRPWPARTRRPRSTSACSRSGRGSRSTSWPRRSTRSRRRRGSSTGCSPTRGASSTRAPSSRRRRRRRVAPATRLAVRPRRRPARPSTTSDGRAVASAPPGSTGSRSAAAGMHHDVGALADRQPAAIAPRGPRPPGRRRRRAAPGRGVSASLRARTAGVPAGQRGSSRRTASAIPGHGSNGSTGASVPNARTAPVARDRRATCSRSARRARPTASGPGRRPCPRCTGWTLAAIPAATKLDRSAGSSSWTCSSRGISGTRAAVGARTSRAARTAASPIAWICVAIPPSAARSTSSASSSGSVIQTPRRRSGGSGRSGSGSMSSSSAAVRDPSEPSAKQLEPADPGPTVRIARRAASPLRSPCAMPRTPVRRRAARHGRGAAAGRHRRDAGYAGNDQLEVRVRGQAARVVDGDDAEREQLVPDGHQRRLQGLLRRSAGRGPMTSRAAAS